MSTKTKKQKSWYVYIIEACDGSLYTGITTDIERRFKQHLSGRGARYFRKSAPKEIVYRQKLLNRSEASKREAQIKKMSKEQKLSLI